MRSFDTFLQAKRVMEEEGYVYKSSFLHDYCGYDGSYAAETATFTKGGEDVTVKLPGYFPS